MTKIRLYIDEDAVERGFVQSCRSNDIDVITTLDANRLTYADEAQLIWANEQRRVIYTFNKRDFSQLHSNFLVQSISHSGIILAQQQRYSIGQQLRGLLKLIRSKSSEEMINQLVYLGNYMRIE